MKLFKYPSILAMLMMVAIALLTNGCTTTKIDPDTGQPVEVYDPVKTQQVKDAVHPALASPVRRVLENNPKKREDIAGYFREIGTVFKAISSTGVVNLDTMSAAIETVTSKYQSKIDPIAIDVKNSAVALFKIFYGDRFKAELPESSWVKHTADTIYRALDQGLRDAGLPGVP